MSARGTSGPSRLSISERDLAEGKVAMILELQSVRIFAQEPGPDMGSVPAQPSNVDRQEGLFRTDWSGNDDGRFAAEAVEHL